jgi:thioredoxin-related protein
MKKLFAALLLCALALTARAHQGNWLTNFDEAKKKAAAENKPILALFTGTDWCPTCNKWEKDAFNTPEFQTYAETNLVLLLVDFPEKKKLPKAQQKANDKLKDKLDVEEFPQVVIVNPKGKKIGTFTYAEGGPNVLLGKITSTLEGKVDKKQ